ncbi:hypothetical protein [Actinoplanes sp. NPDC051851]|uniref:hypothetical protein n=1 Tax=Actinoplanes sp. NPDC051851 TaxID=3154753 RepID=UPI003416F247
MSGFEVTPDQLAAHAAEVKAIAADVAECRAAGDAVGFGGTEAYGLLLQAVLPPVLELALGDTCDLLANASDLAQAFSTGVQSNNECYLRNEDEIAAMFSALGESGR